MGAERDHLVKFIFPELRRLCESRGVTWGEVDLRWGVTDEEAAEGKVLPICLEEIKRCRPYFIGILGERYGWVPETIPQELIEREPWLEEQLAGKKSVTELEILHGVLRNEEMHQRACFYFRDPKFVESVPQEKKANFITESAEHSRKLDALKNEIRRASKEEVCHLREPFTNVEELGQWVKEDFEKIIDELWPEGSQPDPLDREAMDHEAFAQSRARVYIGRQEYFDRLDAHANGSGDQPLVILGESGSGKSALVANWALRHSASHPDELLIQHFIGGTPYSSDWAAMLRRIIGEFKRRLGIAQDIPDQPDALRSAFPNWLHMAAAKGRVILILDALNQLEDRDGAPDLVWLPPVMPENVRLIVSTLPGRALDKIKECKCPVLNVEPLDAAERKKLISDFLAQSSRRLSPARIERIASAPQSASPLYLRVLLDELRVFGEHERLDERITHYLQAQTIPELFERVLARWDHDYSAGINLVRDSMSLIWAARRGLSEAELLDALGKKNKSGERKPLPRAKWSPLFLAESDSLVGRSGLITFFHDYLREAVQRSYLPNEDGRKAAHLRLADFFQHQASSPRRTDELPWQLAETSKWHRLQALLVDHGFFNEAWKMNEFEVKAYWTQIESKSSMRLLEAYRVWIKHPERQEDDGFLWSLSIFLGDMGYLAEALRLREHLANHFRRIGDRANLAPMLGNQALILKIRGDLDSAMALHEQEEQIYRELGYKAGLATSLGNQAVSRAMRGDLEGAMALHEQEERICRELGDKPGLRATLGNQANILFTRNDLDAAMALRKQEEQLCRELGNNEGLGISLLGQANILSERGDTDGAMALHKQSEQIFRELGNKHGLAQSLGSQANMLSGCGDSDGAMALYERSEQIFRELGDKSALWALLVNRADILSRRGDIDGAMALYKQSEGYCRELDLKEGLQTSLVRQTDLFNNQAAKFMERGDLAGAMALLRQTEKVCVELGNKNALQATLDFRAQILQGHGDLDGAMSLRKQEEQICRELGDKNRLKTSLRYQALMLQASGNLYGAMALHKQIEQICRDLGNKDSLVTSLVDQANILYEDGDLDEAMVLYKQSAHICRELGNNDGLQASLGNQAVILQTRGDLDGAMALHKQKEQICRELGNKDGLQTSLGNQATILQTRGDLEGAIALHKQKEQICRELGKKDGLARSLANQSLVLQQMGHPKDGIPLAEEALRLARMYGFALLSSQFEQLLASLKYSAEVSASRSTSPVIDPTPPRESTISDLRESAASAMRRSLWEAAETYLQKLLDRSELLQTVAPDLITALLNAHADPLPATIDRVRKLISELEELGHNDLALAARRQLEAKLPPAKKPWWKVW